MPSVFRRIPVVFKVATSRSSSIALIFLLLLATLQCVPALHAQDSPAPETLTNADVVTMVHAHLSADVIVKQIQDSPANFSLTVKSLTSLKQQGVPDRVIAAMQAKKGGSAPPPSSKTVATAKPSNPCGDSDGKWRIEEKKNELTGRTARQAIMCEAFGQDNASVTATCGFDDLTFEIGYFKPGQDVVLKSIQPNVTYLLGAPLPHDPFVSVNIRIDSGQVIPVHSKLEYQNAVKLRFIAKKDYSNDGFGYFADLGAAEYTQTAYKANDIRVELPLNDGETPVVHIRPQEDSFKEYAAGCRGSGVPAKPTNTYTVDQFIALLPGIVQKAATAHGLDAHGYDKEMDYIVAALKTCSQITPQMAAGPPDPNAKAGDPKHDQILSREYGQDYQICQGNDSYRHMYFRGMQAEDVSWASGAVQGTPYAVKPIRPDLGFGIYQPQGQLWSDGKGFYVTLEVASETGDVVMKDVQILPQSPSVSP